MVRKLTDNIQKYVSLVLFILFSGGAYAQVAVMPAESTRLSEGFFYHYALSSGVPIARLKQLHDATVMVEAGHGQSIKKSAGVIVCPEEFDLMFLTQPTALILTTLHGVIDTKGPIRISQSRLKEDYDLPAQADIVFASQNDDIAILGVAGGVLDERVCVNIKPLESGSPHEFNVNVKEALWFMPHFFLTHHTEYKKRPSLMSSEVKAKNTFYPGLDIIVTLEADQRQKIQGMTTPWSGDSGAPVFNQDGQVVGLFSQSFKVSGTWHGKYTNLGPVIGEFKKMADQIDETNYLENKDLPGRGFGVKTPLMLSQKDLLYQDIGLTHENTQVYRRNTDRHMRALIPTFFAQQGDNSIYEFEFRTKTERMRMSASLTNIVFNFRHLLLPKHKDELKAFFMTQKKNSNGDCFLDLIMPLL